MFEWRIEATLPTQPSDLKGVLEKARDTWVRTTAQRSDTAVATMNVIIAEAINEARGRAVAERNKMIEAHAASLDKTHSAILRQMNAGIAAACVIASGMAGDMPVRASVYGHYDANHGAGIDERVNATVDQAAHESTDEAVGPEPTEVAPWAYSAQQAA